MRIMYVFFPNHRRSQVARMADTVEVDSSLTGDNVDRNSHFSPDLSNVLSMILKV